MESMSNAHETTKPGNAAYKYAAGIALAAALILVWLSLALASSGRMATPPI